MLSLRSAAVVPAVFVLATAALGDEAPPAGQLPPPRQIVPEMPPPRPYPMGKSHSAYEVWQYYGVDRTGHFRPRVIDTPYGGYYYYNGVPYPWTSLQPYYYMPYVMD